MSAVSAASHRAQPPSLRALFCSKFLAPALWLEQWCKQNFFVYNNCSKAFPSKFSVDWSCPVIFSSQRDYQPSQQTDKSCFDFYAARSLKTTRMQNRVRHEVAGRVSAADAEAALCADSDSAHGQRCVLQVLWARRRQPPDGAPAVVQQQSARGDQRSAADVHHVPRQSTRLFALTGAISTYTRSVHNLQVGLDSAANFPANQTKNLIPLGDLVTIVHSCALRNNNAALRFASSAEQTMFIISLQMDLVRTSTTLGELSVCAAIDLSCCVRSGRQNANNLVHQWLARPAVRYVLGFSTRLPCVLFAT